MPLYTYYLTVEEYGTVDLVLTTISLVLPVVTLSVYEAVLRYVMDRNDLSDKVFINATVVLLAGYTFMALILPLLQHLRIFDGQLIFLYILIVLQGIYALISQFTRALGLIKLYAVNSLFLAILIALLSVIFLAVLGMRLTGYLLALTIAYLLSATHLVIRVKIVKYLYIRSIDFTVIKILLIYAVPLIPNSIMWWVTSTSNRYIILFFTGVYANGLFALANKIPSLLTLVYSVFYQAWQLSAIEEIKSKDNAAFFSKVYEYFTGVLIIGTSLILVFIKPIIHLSTPPNFFESWKLVPFLLLGVFFSNLAGFLGANYLAAMNTSGVLKTTVISAVANIIFSLLLIPLLGALGASISTMIGFMVLWVIRLIDTKKIIQISYNIKWFLLNTFILILQISTLYLELEYRYELLLELLLLCLIVLVNRNLIQNGFHFANSTIKTLLKRN